MKLKVPFVRNLKVWKGRGWCGPLALASILRYYGFKDSVPDIVEFGKTHKNGGTCPQGLINFCLEKGMMVEYFSESEYEKNNNPKYSKRLQSFLKSVDAERLDKYFWKKNIENKSFKFHKHKATLGLIEKYLDCGRPVLIIHNVALIYGKDNLWPHYIAVVGHDKDNFYIHNVAIKNQRFQKVNKKLLEKSWSSDGLDKQLIVPLKI